MSLFWQRFVGFFFLSSSSTRVLVKSILVIPLSFCFFVVAHLNDYSQSWKDENGKLKGCLVFLKNFKVANARENHDDDLKTRRKKSPKRDAMLNSMCLFMRALGWHFTAKEKRETTNVFWKVLRSYRSPKRFLSPWSPNTEGSFASFVGS